MGFYNAPLPKETTELMFGQWLSVIARRECASIVSLPRFDRYYRVAQFLGSLDDTVKKTYHFVPISLQSLVTEIWEELKTKISALKHPTKYTVFLVTDAEWLLTAAGHLAPNFQEFVLMPYRSCSFFLFFEKNIVDPSFHTFTQPCTVFLQNVIYQPLYTREDIDHFIRHMAGIYGCSFSKREREDVWDLCGGYIWLVTEAIRNLHKNGELTFDHPEMTMRLKAIWDGFSHEEQGALRTIARNQAVEEGREHCIEYLQRAKLVSEIQGKLRVVVPILARYIQERDANEQDFRLDEKGEIVCGATRVTAVFTKKQQDLIRYLLAHKKGVIAREAVARLLWGKNFEESYSDWGLDQAMKRLRQKFINLGISRPLIRTVKSRGYICQ